MSLEGLELELFIDLVESMAVVIVVAYLFTRTKLFRQVLDRQLGRQGRLLLILIFGAFSIWGTLSGVEIQEAIANTRNLGPALGGLVGGPLVGLGAGVIGGLHRLSLGGWTAVPSALGTLAAGLAGGVVFLLFGRRVAPVWAAVLLAVFTESVLMGLNLLMARPFSEAVVLVEEVMLPMILVNAAGMGLFVFIVPFVVQLPLRQGRRLTTKGTKNGYCIGAFRFAARHPTLYIPSARGTICHYI